MTHGGCGTTSNVRDDERAAAGLTCSAMTRRAARLTISTTCDAARHASPASSSRTADDTTESRGGVCGAASAVTMGAGRSALPIIDTSGVPYGVKNCMSDS
jgi:hypothetical protein